ncbi:MAG: hypothetical protein F4065_09580 [Rhodothermaceae bacterium]|nr:hypothetical protein [Rhodothermaceae bacterium]MXX96973.1 hypothetical protein [Rhodothermaceae bacterium]MXZ57233.1 hypothetical protein [Rhodothermaceae bacterium]MYB90929.1 hypothetical protein [Rhodothermaceae bacterium]MYC03517.1 hypothetical protein [Rhodothermaceae bacterium]
MNNRWWFFSAVTLVSVSFILGLTGKFHFIPTLELRWPDERVHPEYVPSYGTIPEKELVMVFIGSSTCGYSNDSSLPELIEEAKLKLKDKATDQGWSFSTVGVSIDWITSDGIDHLDKFGYFDEIMTGRKWHGTGANIYLRDIQGINATPQILVLARNPQQSKEDGRKPVQRETPVYRVAGLNQIDNWLSRGLPLPKDVLNTILNINP